MNKNSVLRLQSIHTKKETNNQASNASVMCKKKSSVSVVFCVFPPGTK